ncbi:MAG: hypothetical protein GWN58_64075, partial [Anaerolineae bacterium]|nr:hypothetical protein [Anaerolineae bacterium]
LLAGRSRQVPARLEELHEENDRILIRRITLAPFDQDETSVYLKAVAQLEGRRGDGDAAARLWTWAEERSELAHYL